MKTTQPRNAKAILGTLAAASAASSSQAALVQITLSGNQVSSNGNNLVADITGDSLPDLVFANVQRRAGAYPFFARVQINAAGLAAVPNGIPSNNLAAVQIDVASVPDPDFSFDGSAPFKTQTVLIARQY